jgi:hypothetical protein
MSGRVFVDRPPSAVRLAQPSRTHGSRSPLSPLARAIFSESVLVKSATIWIPMWSFGPPKSDEFVWLGWQSGGLRARKSIRYSTAWVDVAAVHTSPDLLPALLN